MPMKRQPNQMIGLALVLLLVTATLAFAGGRTETVADGDVIAIEYWDENNQNGILMNCLYPILPPQSCFWFD